MLSREELKKQKKEEEKALKKQQRKQKRADRKLERKLKKEGKTNRNRYDERERHRKIDRFLNFMIFIVSLLLVIVWLFVFFV